MQQNIVVLKYKVLCFAFPGMKYDATDPVATRFVTFVNDTFLNSGGLIELLNFFPWLTWVLPDFIKNKYMNVGKSVDSLEEIFSYMRVITMIEFIVKFECGL